MAARHEGTPNRYFATPADEQEMTTAAALAARRAAVIDDRLSVCSRYQAGVVVALAAHRFSAVGELPQADEMFEEYGKLLQSAELMNLAYVLSAPAKHITSEVQARLDPIIGSEDFPLVNPGGSVGYFMSAAATIAYVRAVWGLHPEYAAEALGWSFGLAWRLESRLTTPPATPLGEAETAHQSADIDAVLALGEPISLQQFHELAAAGDALGQAYRARLAEIIAAGI